MDLTKEALDYLAEQSIEPEERQLKISGQNYIINKDGEPVLVEPVIYKAKEPIRLNTLSGLVDYIKSSNLDYNTDHAYLHVVDEKTVELKSDLKEDRERELLAVATAIVPEFKFNSYMDIESFNIALQSQFVKTDDRNILLKVVGNLKEDNVRSTGDDGISQAVTIKSGIATAENIKVPNPVILAPYRTFVEVEQPESKFIFRMQSGPRGAIFEGDGGLWRVEAIKTIAKYLEVRLEGTGVVLLA